MRLVVDGDKPVDADMGVDLRGRQRCVAQYFLDAPQVCAALEQMRSCGMTDAMRAYVRDGSCGSDPGVDHAPDRPGIDPATFRPDEERRGPRCVARNGGAKCGIQWPGTARRASAR